MKHVNKIVLGLFALGLLTTNTSQFLKSNQDLKNLMSISICLAGETDPPPTDYKKKTVRQETEEKTKNGTDYTRSREKTECEGTGNTKCTPSGYSSWTDWGLL